jgi:hypothetical protein
LLANGFGVSTYSLVKSLYSNVVYSGLWINSVPYIGVPYNEVASGLSVLMLKLFAAIKARCTNGSPKPFDSVLAFCFCAGVGIINCKLIILFI